MAINKFLARAALTAIALGVYGSANTAHEVVSPLVSGPMAAQQLTDSNVAYIGTAITSRAFNGSGMGGWFTLVLVLVLVAIWYTPVKNLFCTKEKAN